MTMTDATDALSSWMLLKEITLAFKGLRNHIDSLPTSINVSISYQHIKGCNRCKTIVDGD